MFLIATICVILGVVVALFAIALFILRQKSSLIFGKYPCKGIFYLPKYNIALLVLKYLRNRIYKNNHNKENEQKIMEKFDKPQSLTDDPNKYDFISFIGANANGKKIVITLERRQHGILKACLYLWLPERGLFCSPNLPDMVNFTTDGVTDSVEFIGNGFHIYPEKCMRSWIIRYEGPLKDVANEKLCEVKIDLKFSSTNTHFDYNRDLSASVIADAVARESWNSKFYQMLRNINEILEKRVRYEQNGTIVGKVQIDEHNFALQLKSYRDHSFGTERCLSTIHRYVYFALFLDDGTTIVTGNLSQPSFFLSSLKVGYICTRNGVYKPITKCNFELYAYGEKGVPPRTQNFIVETADETYLVQIKVENMAVRFEGENWDAKVYNQFVSCKVNGQNGHGIAEYLYRNFSGRPASVSDKDPEWYQRSISKTEEHTELDDFC